MRRLAIALAVVALGLTALTIVLRARAAGATELQIYDASDILVVGGFAPGPRPLCAPGRLQRLVRLVAAPEFLFNPETSLEIYRGQLLVNTTPRAHARIAALLARIRGSPRLERLVRGQ